MISETKPIARYSHSGICVTDLERSLAFYKNVLGFTEGGHLTIEHEHNALLGLDGDIDLRSVFLRQGGLVIELLYFRSPTPFNGDTPRALNQCGLTHLSFNVDALDPMLEKVTSWGGVVLTESRSRFSLPEVEGEIIFICDPDGTRIELVAFPEDIQLA